MQLRLSICIISLVLWAGTFTAAGDFEDAWAKIEAAETDAEFLAQISEAMRIEGLSAEDYGILAFGLATFVSFELKEYAYALTVIDAALSRWEQEDGSKNVLMLLADQKALLLANFALFDDATGWARLSLELSEELNEDLEFKAQLKENIRFWSEGRFAPSNDSALEVAQDAALEAASAFTARDFPRMLELTARAQMPPVHGFDEVDVAELETVVANLRARYFNFIGDQAAYLTEITAGMYAILDRDVIATGQGDVRLRPEVALRPDWAAHAIGVLRGFARLQTDGGDLDIGMSALEAAATLTDDPETRAELGISMADLAAWFVDARISAMLYREMAKRATSEQQRTYAELKAEAILYQYHAYYEPAQKDAQRLLDTAGAFIAAHGEADREVAGTVQQVLNVFSDVGDWPEALAMAREMHVRDRRISDKAEAFGPGQQGFRKTRALSLDSYFNALFANAASPSCHVNRICLLSVPGGSE